MASVVLDMISLNYSETLSAAAGHSMEEAKHQTIEAGNYILVYEGAVQKGWDGNALRVAGEVGTVALEDAARNANAVVAIGSCAVNGGWLAAHPNPSNAMGVEQYLREVGIDTTVVNVPGCPVNPEWVMSVLVDVVLLKDPGLLKAQRLQHARRHLRSNHPRQLRASRSFRRTASSCTSSAPRRRRRATASTRWVAAVLRRSRIAA